jgi:hypothetical protein
MSNYAIITNGTVTNVYVADAPLNEADILVTNQGIGWTYANGTFTAPPAPTPTSAQLVANFLASVQSALTESDNTLKRVQEAISLGTNNALATDVIAFMNYRRALRALLKSTSVGTLPTKPAFPQGT